MSLGFQVVFDCHDPARLAEFWTKALDYVLQPPPEGFDDWKAWLQEMQVPEDQWNTMNAVVDPDGGRPRILFQKVPEAKAVKNRVHLDVFVADRSIEGLQRLELRDAKVAELESLGATKIAEYDELGSRWVVMQDPEGNEFCVV